MAGFSAGWHAASPASVNTIRAKVAAFFNGDPSLDTGKSASVDGRGRPDASSAPSEPRVFARGEGWVVVEKPPGLLSVPGKGPDKADCAAARIAAMFPDAAGPLVVHRLDMETSGLMVFGLSLGRQGAGLASWAPFAGEAVLIALGSVMAWRKR